MSPTIPGRAKAALKAAGAQVVTATALVAVLLVTTLTGQADGPGLETRYANIVFAEEGDLLEFGKRLGGPGSLVSSTNPNARAHIRESVDRIVFRVKALLDMHPDGMRFSVRLHSTDRGLREAYKGLGAVGDPPIAFYSHRSRTVHMGLRDATDRVFAHEVAHAVINAYFSVPPPPQVQEILSQYVDKHLWEE